MLVDIDRDARVDRLFYAGTEVSQVYEEWVRIIDGHLDENNIKARESHALKNRCTTATWKHF